MKYKNEKTKTTIKSIIKLIYGTNTKCIPDNKRTSTCDKHEHIGT